MEVRSPRNIFITVSYHSKYAHLAWFPDFADERFVVQYSPPTQASQITPNPEHLKQYGLSDRGYILMVSGNHWIKNGYRAAKALDVLIDRGQLDKQIVITGLTKREIFDVKHAEQFKFLPYVPTEALVALYQGAYCLLYPSLS
jgi:glycosyltransferase involved in cell wall biosynthesis